MSGLYTSGNSSVSDVAVEARSPHASERQPRLWFQSVLLEHGWAHDVRLSLHAGRIERIEVGVPMRAEDEHHAVALPGLPNLHSHGFQRAMAGLTEIGGSAPDNFWSWRDAMYRLVERIGPDEIEAITAFAYIEMLEAGFTRVAEFHYLHHDVDAKPYANVAEGAERIAAAASATGIGLALLPVLYAHANFGGTPPRPAQRRFVNDVEQFSRLIEQSRRAVQPLEGAIVGVAAHSLRAVTPEELAAIRSMGTPFHIHVAEQTKEVEDCLAWSGERPVQWLLNHAEVDEHWCLVHATHVTPEELERITKARAVVGLCPITEANLGDGIFPASMFRAAGGTYGIGSDSNVLIDAAEELRTLEYAQRLTRRRRNVLSAGEGRSTGRALLEAALRGGALALGAVSLPLREGADADLVSLDTEHPSLQRRQDDALLDSWIFAARGRVIDCVWRRGQKLVAGGTHIAREAVAARYSKVLAKLCA